MTTNSHPSHHGFEEHDVAPSSPAESQLQQVLWNNSLWLRDFTPRQLKILVSSKVTAPLFIASEFNVTLPPLPWAT